MSSFTKALLSVPAKDLAKATKCQLRTIYKWRKGERTPPAWTQKWLLDVVKGLVKAK